MSPYHVYVLAVFPFGTVDSVVVEFRVQNHRGIPEVVDRQSFSGSVSREHGVADIELATTE